MTTLIGRFERDVLYLEQGEVPKELSGAEVKSLNYDADPKKTEKEKNKKKKEKKKKKESGGSEESASEEEEAEEKVCLTDADIARLSDALIENQAFSGPLELQNN